MNTVANKVLLQNPCLKFAPVFIYFFFESFGRVETKDKPLIRTENSPQSKCG